MDLCNMYIFIWVYAHVCSGVGAHTHVWVHMDATASPMAFYLNFGGLSLSQELIHWARLTDQYATDLLSSSHSLLSPYSPLAFLLQHWSYRLELLLLLLVFWGLITGPCAARTSLVESYDQPELLYLCIKGKGTAGINTRERFMPLGSHVRS